MSGQGSTIFPPSGAPSRDRITDKFTVFCVCLAPPNLPLSSDRAGLAWSWLPIQILPDGPRYLECDCANVECRLNAVVPEDGFVLRYYFIVTLCSIFLFRVYIYLAEWFWRWWIFVFRDRFYRDYQSKSCGILNVIAPMLNILNAIVVEFYRDSLQYFLFQSRIYIFRVIWNRIWIFYISYLWSLSYRDSQSKSWMSNLMDSSFTRYFVSIFRMEYIYLTEWFRKWWIFYISWSFMIYRDSQSKSWMSNLWWIRRLQNILFQSGVYIYLAEIYLKMVNLLYFVIFILSWFAIEILDVEYLMNCLQNILFRFSKWSIYIYLVEIYIWKWWIFYISWSLSYRDS